MNEVAIPLKVRETGRASRFAACAHCALRVEAENGHGSFCLYYSANLPGEEADNPDAPLRKQCLKDGNKFMWPLKGVSPFELVRWKVEVEKVGLPRFSTLFSIGASVVGMALSVLALLNSLHVFN